MDFMLASLSVTKTKSACNCTSVLLAVSFIYNHNKLIRMPDHLGDDMRKIKHEDKEKEEKDIKGTSNIRQYIFL